ncbi:repeat-containing protein [Seminavis robusta]|uniref:Repeat-containing protein n=1 Tax=Seminavis robusta TaxID=568900 RepID=A0A9N8F2X3_9STRA|nr:repeat-containing protein [Seminavis robusta]|eukprot:Sro2827_g338040.1 repeat-containing protein (119) ;mRNA; r:4579-4935
MSTLYGPFHRVLSPTQSHEVAELQVQSQEVWGRPRRGSDIPQVQAYTGSLPPTEKGIEFVTSVAPDKGTPPGQARWTGPREGVIIKDNFCRIPVTIVKNTQSTTAEAKKEEDALMLAA